MCHYSLTDRRLPCRPTIACSRHGCKHAVRLGWARRRHHRRGAEGDARVGAVAAEVHLWSTNNDRSRCKRTQAHSTDDNAGSALPAALRSAAGACASESERRPRPCNRRMQASSRTQRSRSPHNCMRSDMATNQGQLSEAPRESNAPGRFVSRAIEMLQNEQ